jgi:cell division protein FtsL
MKMNKKIIGMIAAFFLAVILGILSVKAATLWVEDFSCPKDKRPNCADSYT